MIADASPMRSILRAFRVAVGASVLTVLFGVLTNKIVAVTAGTDGVGLLTLFRNVTTFATTLLSAGSSSVIVHAVSTATDPTAPRLHLRRLWYLFLLQAGILVAAAAVLPASVGRYVVGSSDSTFELRIVLVMSLGVLASQAVTDLLSAKARVDLSSRVSVVTSLLTLVSTYPLLLLGKTGLSLMLGLTCFVGAGVGLRWVRAVYDVTWSDLSPRGLSLRDLPLNRSLFVRALLSSGAILASQAIINRGYGTSQLGIYGAAALLESTTVLVIMSAMRAYFLPKLGEMRTVEEKSAFVDSVLQLLLIVLLPASVGLVLLSPLAFEVLFSGRFAASTRLMPYFAIAIVAQAFEYTYALLALHGARFRLSLVLDGGWAVGCAVASWAAVRAGLPIEFIVIAYAVMHWLLAIAYLVAARSTLGPGSLAMRNPLLSVVVVALVLAAARIDAHLAWRALAMIPVLGLAAWLAVRWKRGFHAA